MPEVTSIEVDEEFDPRPTPTPFGLRGPDGELNKGMVAGIVIAVLLVLLVIGAIATSLGGDSGAKKATWKPTDPLKGLESLTTVDPRSPEMVAMASAMNAWSKFGLTGNISEVESTFDKSGPQYAELLKEQAAIQLKPESGDPAVVTINEMGRAGKADKDIKLRGEVVWTKPGFTPNEFFWDVTMRQQSTGSYLLYNVSTADKNKDKVALTFCDAITLIAGMDSSDTVSKEISKLATNDKAPAFIEYLNVRQQVWKVVAAATVGRDDTDNFEQLATLYNSQYTKAKDKTSIKDISSSLSSDADIQSEQENRSVTDAAATEECKSAISDR